MPTPEAFQIHASDDQLDDLRRRLRATRWPEAELVDDWTQGIPLSYMKELVAYWAEKYDWRQREAKREANELDEVAAALVRRRSCDSMEVI